MNDLEHEIRETLRRHENDAPAFDASDARRVAGRTRRRQIVNVAGAGIGALVVVIGLVAGISGLVRADRSPTVIDSPLPSLALEACDPPPIAVGSLPSSTPVATQDDGKHGWPSTSRNPAGIYWWDGGPGDGSHLEGFMHNGYSRSPGLVTVLMEGVPGRLVPHRGQCAATVAGLDGAYRRFIGRDKAVRDEAGGTLAWSAIGRDDAVEEWMVDIQGSTVTVILAADPRTRKAELDEAHGIIESMYVDPQDSVLGFRLVFTLATNTWDSG
jgi:hypothetical protein